MGFHWGIFLIGLAFLLGSILILRSDLKKRKKCTQTVDAQVMMYYTQIEHDHDDGGDTITYHPVMKYCVSGQWYEERSEMGYNKQKYAIGEHTNILVDPSDPKTFRFPGDNISLIASMIGIVLGLAIMVLSVSVA